MIEHGFLLFAGNCLVSIFLPDVFEMVLNSLLQIYLERQIIVIMPNKTKEFGKLISFIEFGIQIAVLIKDFDENTHDIRKDCDTN